MTKLFGPNSQKVKTFIVMVLALVALIILASILSNADLTGGGGEAVIGGGGGPRLSPDPDPELNTADASQLFRNLMIAAGVIFGLLSLRYPKKFGITVLSIAAILLFYYFVLPDDINVEGPTTTLTQPLQEIDEIPVDAIPDPDYTEAPDWYSWLFNGVIIAVALALAYVAYYRYLAPWLLPEPSDSLDQLADEAEQAIGQIEAGIDLSDAILNCYARMVDALQRDRGASFDRSMTPREFELKLTDRGLPMSSVERLTRLFEMVRYGGADLGERERLEAVSCLEEVVSAIREGVLVSAEIAPAT